MSVKVATIVREYSFIVSCIFQVFLACSECSCVCMCAYECVHIPDGGPRFLPPFCSHVREYCSVWWIVWLFLFLVFYIFGGGVIVVDLVCVSAVTAAAAAACCFRLFLFVRYSNDRQSCTLCFNCLRCLR